MYKDEIMKMIQTEKAMKEEIKQFLDIVVSENIGPIPSKGSSEDKSKKRKLPDRDREGEAYQISKIRKRLDTAANRNMRDLSTKSFYDINEYLRKHVYEKAEECSENLQFEEVIFVFILIL